MTALACGIAAMVAAGLGLYWMGRLRRQLRHDLAELQSERDELAKRCRILSHDVDGLVRHCGAGVLLLGADDVVEAANEEAVRLLDFAVAEPKGRKLVDVAIGLGLSELVAGVRASRLESSAETQRIGPGGGCVALYGAPLESSAGTDGRVLVIAHDVTDRRRLEVLRRDFVANVSHELRTPMASIRALAETLRDGALDDADVADRFLETIIAESERLSRIADDLLVLSDAESRAPEKAPFSLSDLLEQTVRRMRAQADKAGVDLAMPPQNVDCRVLGNADQIEQVLVNLIDNALKYTPKGGRVTVACARDAASVRVSVTDTGIGIMREHLPRVFERFYRVDKARSRQSGGTGLGLAIVKNIIEAHGGSVSVESEYNKGSVFTVALPAVPAAL